jgi:hypothetical protein
MIGADHHTLQYATELTEFIVNSNLADVSLTVQTPFPGSALYDQLKNEDRLLQNRSCEGACVHERDELPLHYQPPSRMIYGRASTLVNVLNDIIAHLKSMSTKNVWDYDYYCMLLNLQCVKAQVSIETTGTRKIIW